MCVCMYVLMYDYIYVLYVSMYVCMCVCVYVLMYDYIYLLYVSMYVCMCVCMYVLMYDYIYLLFVCMYVCMYACMCMYVPISKRCYILRRDCIFKVFPVIYLVNQEIQSCDRIAL